MSDRKAVIKNADMSEEMQQDAVDCATQALEKYNIEKVCSPLFGLYLNLIWFGPQIFQLYPSSTVQAECNSITFLFLF